MADLIWDDSNVEESSRWASAKRTCTAVFTILNLLVSIATISIGAIFVNDCPRQHMIPIYLIVTGCCIFIRTFRCVVGLCIASIYDNPNEVTPQKLPRKALDVFLVVFPLSWLLSGSIWVFSTHKDYQDSDPSQDSFCASALFKYAFRYTLAAYIGMILTVVLYIPGYTIYLCCWEIQRLRRVEMRLEREEDV
ncbi:hypothetical protein CAPTEDRAFT_188868 [Capitella teleta]|uniref:G-protein coupled receptors family 1 profile domain-containing protein n=1 Tax=Capitella teleta TaxID=283909 RepID=R7T600_CAPTE|nr:hypothetical protein CAPTEDRAFT_188868 [Capitella teleta]|eukprot:ELT88750.1 hypothetical protein CAPTEDRAFT_188868 [Capitella teleta]